MVFVRKVTVLSGVFLCFLLFSLGYVRKTFYLLQMFSTLHTETVVSLCSRMQKGTNSY